MARKKSEVRAQGGSRRKRRDTHQPEHHSGHQPGKQHGRGGGQLAGLVRASHPRQALVAFLVGFGGGLLTHRSLTHALVGGLALLVVQLICGLGNDAADAERDREAGVAKKPVAAGVVPKGNAVWVAVCLTVLAVPLCLQNGKTAGIAALCLIPIAYLYNKVLRRTVLSWVPWALSGAVVALFLSYAGWGLHVEGSAPQPLVLVFAALLGIGVHFLLALPDLVADNQTGTRHLPLRLALKTGAPRLLMLSAVFTVAVIAGLVFVIIATGLHA